MGMEKAVALRVLLLAGCVQTCKLAWLLSWAWLLPDYDTSSIIPPSACRVNVNTVTAPQLGWSLVVWDSSFYASIACGGYQYEQQYAFFPLLPALLRPWRHHPTLLPWAGLLISSLCGTFSALLMYRLTQDVTKDSQLSAVATLAFVFYPAGVFTSAIYTESLFTLLTMAGLNCLYTQKRGNSQGVVYAGFLAHAAAQAALDCMQYAHHNNKGEYIAVPVQAVVSGIFSALLLMVSGAGAAIVTAAPLLLHQLHAHWMFCGTQTSANMLHAPGAVGDALRTVVWLLWEPSPDSPNLSAVPLSSASHNRGALPPWCDSGRPAWWPSAYGHVQRQYWDVGFMKYWKPAQIPNFLLAAPVLFLAASCLMTYFCNQTWHMLKGGFIWCRTGCIQGSSSVGSNVGGCTGSTVPDEDVTRKGVQDWSSCTGSMKRRGKHKDWQRAQEQVGSRAASPGMPETQSQPGPSSVSGLFAPEVAVFIYPLAFMTVTALLVMHVQVSTRFLSSSPALYWYMAHLLLGNTHEEPAWTQMHEAKAIDNPYERPITLVGKRAAWLWAWCWLYLLVGGVLFANFLPWT